MNEFLSLIHIIPDDGLVQNEYENLFSFFEYLKDFIEEKTRSLTVNRITLGNTCVLRYPKKKMR